MENSSKIEFLEIPLPTYDYEALAKCSQFFWVSHLMVGLNITSDHQVRLTKLQLEDAQELEERLRKSTKPQGIDPSKIQGAKLFEIKYVIEGAICDIPKFVWDNTFPFADYKDYCDAFNISKFTTIKALKLANPKYSLSELNQRVKSSK